MMITFILWSLAAAQDSTANETLNSYDRARTILEASLSAYGGKDKLSAVTSLALRENGEYQWVHQSATPEPPWRRGTVEERTVVDFKENRLLIDTRISAPEYYFGWPAVAIASGEAWQLDQYSEMATPLPGTSLKDYDDHFRQRFPYRILLDALRRAASLRFVGEAKLSGQLQDVITFIDANGRQVSLYVDQSTRRMTRYEWLYVDPVLGDSVGSVRFVGSMSCGGIPMPRGRERWRGGEWLTRTRYVECAVDNPQAAETFTVPSSYERLPHRPPLTQIEVSKIAQDVFYLQGFGGGRYHVLALEFDDHIVVVNAPISSAVGTQVLQRVRETIPAKPIRRLVLTHHAYDHIAGLRPFVAEGISIVTTAKNEGFIERLTRAPFTMEPDALALRPRRPQFERIVGGRHVLEDKNHRVELVDLGPDPAWDEAIVVYLPRHRLLFQADLLNPNYANSFGRKQPGAERVLERRLTELGLNVEWIAGGHGWVVKPEVLRQMRPTRGGTTGG